MLRRVSVKASSGGSNHFAVPFGCRSFAKAKPVFPEEPQPASAASTVIQYHGGGLSSLHRPRESEPAWRIQLSNFLTERLRASRRTRANLASRQLYVRVDTLHPALLSFFYGSEQCGLPKTFQSWFALTQMHVWMLQTRFRSCAEREPRKVSTMLLDHLTTDIEMKLWSSGVTNSRLHDQHVKELLSFHYGCSLAYDEGYESSDPVLASAIWRNIYTMAPNIEPHQLCNMVLYFRHQMQHIHGLPLEELLEGNLELSLPPKELVELPASTTSSATTKVS